MALGPKQLEEQVREEQKDAVEQLEAQVDKALKNNYDRREMMTVPLPDTGIRRFVLDEVVARYMAAGWAHVEVKSDQREGTWLEFRRGQAGDNYAGPYQ